MKTRWYVCRNGCKDSEPFEKLEPFNGVCPHCNRSGFLTRLRNEPKRESDEISGARPLRMYECFYCGLMEIPAPTDHVCPKCHRVGIRRTDRCKGHWTPGDEHCPTCGCSDYEVVPQTFKNNTTHHRLQCARCHKFFKFLPQHPAKESSTSP